MTTIDLHDQLDTLLAAMFTLIALQRGRSPEQRAMVMATYDQLRELHAELMKEMKS